MKVKRREINPSQSGVTSQEKFLSAVDPNVACINLQIQPSLQILIMPWELHRRHLDGSLH